MFCPKSSEFLKENCYENRFEIKFKIKINPSRDMHTLGRFRGLILHLTDYHTLTNWEAILKTIES